jgi:hypothetical protein
MRIKALILFSHGARDTHLFWQGGHLHNASPVLFSVCREKIPGVTISAISVVGAPGCTEGDDGFWAPRVNYKIVMLN